MALYDRLLGRNDAGGAVDNKIPVHQFQALASEWQRGRLTGAQASAAIGVLSGAALTTAEQTEVQTLVNTVPTGQTTANQAARALRLHEIDQILLLGDTLVAGYDTPTAIKAKLGV